MSFAGVTFTGQTAAPSDDALLMQTILNDGVLYGCALDYAGFTLSMAAGQLIACGRNIRHPDAESWAVIGGTSGYARASLSIDLSKAVSAETFDQIDVSIDYASTPDGFPALEQSEINVSGVKYQMELCVVSLSTGGITGIVRQLPRASLKAGPDFLSALFAAGYTKLSPYQIVAELPDATNLPDYTVVGLLMGEV